MDRKSTRAAAKSPFLTCVARSASNPSCCKIAITLNDQRSKREIAFYEKVIKVKADVAAYLINCFSSA